MVKPGLKDRCFVCNLHIKPVRKGEERIIPTSKECELLLENILGVPKSSVKEYLKEHGLLQNWIQLCFTCTEILKESLQINNLIEELNGQFRERQEIIISKLKISQEKNKEVEKENGDLGLSKTIQSIHESVLKRSMKDVPSPVVRKTEFVLVESESEEEESLLQNKELSGQPEVDSSVEKYFVYAKSGQLLLVQPSKPAIQTTSKSIPDKPTETKTEEFTVTGGHVAVEEVTSPARFEDYDWEMDESESETEAAPAEENEDEPLEFAMEGLEESLNDPPKKSLQKEPVTKRRRMQAIPYTYSCPNCPKVKNYWVNRYSQHLALHQRRPFRCVECHEFFTDTERHEEHWRERHANKQLPEGSDGFVRVPVEPGEIWKCEGCYDGFLTEEERNVHEATCDYSRCLQKKLKSLGKPVTCKTCQKSFRIREEWRLHRVLEHPEVDSLCCIYCDENFGAPVQSGSVGGEIILRNDWKCRVHLKSTHVEGEKLKDGKLHDECEICGIVFTGSSPLKKNHVLKEHGIPWNKAHSCKICGVSYADARYVWQHMSREHFLCESSICDICGESFLTLNHLKNHKFQKHQIVPETGIYQCTEDGCSYQTVILKKFRAHFNSSHKNAISLCYKCEYCGKGFKNGTYLRRHVQSHVNKDTKPFQCDICGAGFAIWNSLYIHKRLSHEKRKFPGAFKKKPPRMKNK